MLALAWVIDSRTLWSGGYVSALESENYGNRWAPWRWRVWAGVPRNAFGRFLADGACLVSVVGVEWRWAWMTLMEAAAFREPRLLLATPAKLRIAREKRRALSWIQRRSSGGGCDSGACARWWPAYSSWPWFPISPGAWPIA